MGIDLLDQARFPVFRRDQLPLGGWYADPLGYPQARTLRQQAHRALQQTCAAGEDSFKAHLLGLVADYWLGHPVEVVHRGLAHTATDDYRHALADLVFGQLLMSRKCNGAARWLDAGFARAANLFRADEYFRVLKRHTVLRALVLTDRPAPAQPLAFLLEEATVISRLTASNGGTGRDAWSPEDTLG